jgi:tRNA(Arg) A34 adenosine deaminase TadA
MNEADRAFLRRCIELATEALEAGDAPFGSLLVSGEGRVLREERNRISSGDRTRHPEFALARWSAENMAPAERVRATVYTSGEHCAMCSAAHAWVGLGRIVYACSAKQLRGWLDELGAPPSPVALLAIQEVAPGIVVDGPAPELAERIRGLHYRFNRAR